MYDDHSTITGGRKELIKPTDSSFNVKAFALVSELANCWTGPYKVLFVGPSKMADGREVGPKLLPLDIEADELSHCGINARVSVHRCINVFNPYEEEVAPRFLRGP